MKRYEEINRLKEIHDLMNLQLREVTGIWNLKFQQVFDKYEDYLIEVSNDAEVILGQDEQFTSDSINSYAKTITNLMDKGASVVVIADIIDDKRLLLKNIKWLQEFKDRD